MHVRSNFHLQSNPSTTVSTRPSLSTCSTFTASSETDSIYIISRTHNNSQLQPALLHEYIEGRFPATLFHDWTPKDRSGVGWKGKRKREMASEETALNEVCRKMLDTSWFTNMYPLSRCSNRNTHSTTKQAFTAPVRTQCARLCRKVTAIAFRRANTVLAYMLL